MGRRLKATLTKARGSGAENSKAGSKKAAAACQIEFHWTERLAEYMAQVCATEAQEMVH
jgi:hypothetical protein